MLRGDLFDTTDIRCGHTDYVSKASHGVLMLLTTFSINFPNLKLALIRSRSMFATVPDTHQYSYPQDSTLRHVERLLSYIGLELWIGEVLDSKVLVLIQTIEHDILNALIVDDGEHV